MFPSVSLHLFRKFAPELFRGWLCGTRFPGAISIGGPKPIQFEQKNWRLRHLQIPTTSATAPLAAENRAAAARSAPALMLIREAALDDGITKKLDELRWRQAAYAASRRRIADAQMAIVENKRLGVSDPSCDAML